MTAIAIAVGLLTGVLSGFGIGGGSLLILYLTAVVGTEQYVAGGINLLYFLCCAPTALISHIRHKRVEWQAVLWCSLTGIITSLGAAWLASVLETDLLRRGFGVLLLYIGTRELLCKSEKNSPDHVK
ncbi:MAG: sulfite exporter TauE/SafE family protein [Clostridia bacterium]|nr:sulfite exporter TauE/SafE family protein [Clostridia bacterium]